MELINDNERLFDFGQLYMTEGINNAIQETNIDGFHIKANEMWHCIERHLIGDWGDLGEEDKKQNEEALQSEGRLFSMYHNEYLGKIYIITEWDRSYTTVLFPGEY